MSALAHAARRFGLCLSMGTVVGAASPAFAQDELNRDSYPSWTKTVAPPPAPEVDPMVPTGITLTSVAGAGIISGAVMLGTSGAQGGETCGLNGCFDLPDHDYRIGGIALLSGSVVLGLAGGGIWAGGASGEPRVREDDALVVAGSSMVGIGLGATTSGLAALIAQRQSEQATELRSNVGPWAGTLAAVGGVTTVVGIPLWVAGASDWTAPTNEEASPARRRPERSPVMKSAGILITVLGSGMYIGSAVLTADPPGGSSDDGFAGLGRAVPPLLLAALGTASVGVGIPLWAVGASDRPWPERPDPTEAWVRQAIPDVRIGAGTMELTWTH